jgi:hypothetical protein
LPKLPAPPDVSRLAASSPAWRDVTAGTVLWRVHATTGAHPQPWNTLRQYGPVASCRFDPHSEPPRAQTTGVAYTALSVPTALAERFQSNRRVNRSLAGAHLTGFRPARALRLLDLAGDWPLRAGASHTLNTGRRDVCRAWARAFVAAWPDLDGLWHISSMTGLPCLTLFTAAADCFPSAPVFSEPLSHPGLETRLATACEQIGYRLL